MSLITQTSLDTYYKPCDYCDYVDFENSHIIHQREASKSKCAEDINILSTYSINGCIFIILYDADKKIAVAAHWDDDTKREELEVLFQAMEQEGSNIDNIKVYLIGGWGYPYMPTGTFLEQAIKSKNITNLDTSHLFEKSPWTDDSDESLLQAVNAGSLSLKEHYFSAISFDVCSDSLKLSDHMLALPDKKKRKLPKNCLTPFEVEIPFSGCKLKFIAPRESS